MDFLQEVISEYAGGSPRPVTLDITYDDPELHALVSVISSDWDSKNLTDSLKQGRLTNDLWALGLSTPEEVSDVCTVDDRYCRVQAVVMCDDLTDLSSLSDPTNKYTEQLKIKSIAIKERSPLAQDSTRILPITSVYDYYRCCHLQEGPCPFMPLASIPPFTPISTWEQSQKDPKPIAALLRTIEVPRKTPEARENAWGTELELALQTRRLTDTRRELEQSQAHVKRLLLQLKDHEPASAEAPINGEGGREIPTAVMGDDASEDLVANESPHSITKNAHAIEGDNASEVLSCVRCELRSHSAKLSELHVRAMELRLSMFERKQTETESHAVRLFDALQSERRLRLSERRLRLSERRLRMSERRLRMSERKLRLALKEKLVAERHKRQGAEAMGEAIANEAKWPFIMPGMLNVFLKLQGMVEEVNRESGE